MWKEAMVFWGELTRREREKPQRKVRIKDLGGRGGSKLEPQNSQLRKGMPNWSTVTFRVISLGLGLAVNILGSRDGPVGTATGQRDKRCPGFKSRQGHIFFCSLKLPHRVWGPYPRGKVDGTWCWPLALIQCSGKEWVELYLYSPPVWLHVLDRDISTFVMFSVGMRFQQLITFTNKCT